MVTERRWLKWLSSRGAHRLAHLRPGWPAAPWCRRGRARRCRSMSSACCGRRRHLHDDVVLLAVALVAGDLAAAQHGLHRAATASTDTPRSSPALAVDLHLQFGLVQTQVAVGLHDAGVLAISAMKFWSPVQLGIAVAWPRSRKLIGRSRKPCPSEGGVTGKPITPGSCENLRLQLARDVLRAAGALFPVGLSRRIALPKSDRRKTCDDEVAAASGMVE
jgi:hypothetical protein